MAAESYAQVKTKLVEGDVYKASSIPGTWVFYLENTDTGEIEALTTLVLANLTSMTSEVLRAVVDKNQRRALDYHALQKKILSNLSKLESGKMVQVMALALYRGTKEDSWCRNQEDPVQKEIRLSWSKMGFEAGKNVPPSAPTVIRFLRVSGPLTGLLILKTRNALDAKSELFENPGLPSAIPENCTQLGVATVLKFWLCHMYVKMKKVQNPPILDLGTTAWTTAMLRTAIALVDLRFSKEVYGAFWAAWIASEDAQCPLKWNVEVNKFDENPESTALLQPMEALIPKEVTDEMNRIFKADLGNPFKK